MQKASAARHANSIKRPNVFHRTRDLRALHDEPGQKRVDVRVKIPVHRHEDDHVQKRNNRLVAQAAEEQLGLKIDKKKIQLKEQIKSLGVHNVPIKLHPKVTTELKVHVVEE